MLSTVHIFVLTLISIDFVCCKNRFGDDFADFDELDFLTTTTTKAPKIPTKYDENIKILRNYRFTESDYDVAYKGMSVYRFAKYVYDEDSWNEAVGHIQLEEFKRVAKSLYYIDGIEQRFDDLLNKTNSWDLYYGIGLSSHEISTCQEIGQFMRFLDAKLPQVRECCHLRLDGIVEGVKKTEVVKDEKWKDMLVENFVKTSKIVSKELTNKVDYARKKHGTDLFWKRSKKEMVCKSFD